MSHLLAEHKKRTYYPLSFVSAPQTLSAFFHDIHEVLQSLQRVVLERGTRILVFLEPVIDIEDSTYPESV